MQFTIDEGGAGPEAPGLGVRVTVTGLVSPLDTGAIHGRGRGVLLEDRSVSVTFLLTQVDFLSLRRRMLAGEDEVSFEVSMEDVTAIEAAREAS